MVEDKKSPQNGQETDGAALIKDTNTFSHYNKYNGDSKIANIFPTGDFSLREFYHFTQEPPAELITLQEQIEVEQNETVQAAMKRQADYITPAGIFKSRSKDQLVEPSGLFFVDIDKLSLSEVPELFNKLKDDPFVCFIKRSLRGKLHVLLKIDNAQGDYQKDFYPAIEAYFLQEYAMKIDDKCSDVSRACFCSYDPDCFLNENSEVLDGAFIDTFKHEPEYKPSIISDDTVIQNLLKWVDNQESFINGNRNNYITKLAHAFNRYGVSENDALTVCKRFAQDGFTNREIETTVRSIFKNHAHAHNTKQFEPSTRQTVPNKVKRKETKENADYFQARTIDEVFRDGALAPERKSIIGSFLYEDTNHYLFSRTNIGKTIITFQFGYCAATGTNFADCIALRNESTPKRVLIADLEMDAQTLWERHGKAIERISPEHRNNLLYLHENAKAAPVFGFDLLKKIEDAAYKHRAELIILDNISKVLPDLLKADDVAKVIEFMKRIRQNTGASFLVIGHTTKGDPRTAITPTSYYGSAALQNFFTEVSFIDATRDGKFFLCHSKTKRKMFTQIMFLL
jgi:hypothetical protein